MKKYLLIAFAILIPIVIAGCILVSGTKVITFELSGMTSPAGGLKIKYVDLPSDNSDYNDNKNKIKSIDEVVLVGDIINSGSNDIQTAFYISDSQYSTVSQVTTPGNSTVIFQSPTVHAGETLHLNWADALAHVQNFDVLKAQLLNDGQFYIYAVSTNGSLIEYDLDLIITLTVGL
jgi:hypothetical protein